MTKTIDLTGLDAADKMYRQLIGFDNGLAARGLLGLDQLDEGSEPIKAVTRSDKVKDYIIITPSFVDGLFRPSLYRCGSVAAFFERFTFIGERRTIAMIGRGIDHSWLYTPEGSTTRLLRERDALERTKKVYPIDDHPWMAGYIAHIEAYINTIEADIDRH